MKSQRRRGKRHRVLALFALVVSALFVWTAWGNEALERTDVTIRSSRIPKAMNGFTIAQLSDLHDAELGHDNADIVDMLRDIRPDVIVMTGDMVDSNRTNIDLSVSLARQIVGIAPVYFVNGNHEAALSWNEYHRFTRELSQAGVIVLEDRSEVLSYNGAAFQIIGLTDPGFIPGSLEEKFAAVQNALTLLKREDMFSIVLAHRPELLNEYAACKAELVLTGHVHGGQFRLPLIGGIYAPSQGFFPEFDAGLYTQGETQMYISRGIGNSAFPFRFNNRPEIVVYTLASS